MQYKTKVLTSLTKARLTYPPINPAAGSGARGLAVQALQLVRRRGFHVYWAKFLIQWHARPAWVRHPHDTAATSAQQFPPTPPTQPPMG